MFPFYQVILRLRCSQKKLLRLFWIAESMRTGAMLSWRHHRSKVFSLLSWPAKLYTSWFAAVESLAIPSMTDLSFIRILLVIPSSVPSSSFRSHVCVQGEQGSLQERALNRLQRASCKSPNGPHGVALSEKDATRSSRTI